MEYEPEEKCCFDSKGELIVNHIGAGGRSVFSTVHHPVPGGIIFSNMPFACVLLRQYWNSYCANCFTKSSNLFKCSKCTHFRYCNISCQRDDWTKHKHECSKLNVLFSLSDTKITEILLLLRVFSSKIVRPTTCSIVSDQIVSCSKTHVDNLVFPSGSMHSYDNDVISLASKYCHQSPALIMHMQQIFKSNNFGIMDNMLQCIGAGVYPGAAMINHSCTPNCVLRFELGNKLGPILHIVNIKEIKVGDELSHSYVDSTLPTVLRRNQLRSTYGFHCECPRCIGPTYVTLPARYLEALRNHSTDILLVNPLILKNFWEIHVVNNSSNNDRTMSTGGEDTVTVTTEELLLSLTSDRKEYESAMKKVKHNQKEILRLQSQDDDRNTSLNKEIQLLEQSESRLAEVCGPLHVDLYQVRGQLFTSCLMAGPRRQEQAILLCCQLVQFLAVILNSIPNHPLLGLQLCTLGDLLKQRPEYRSLAQLSYRWATEILAVAQGNNSEFVRFLLAGY